ncbi:MAG: Fic family protein [Granulosicoccus sp.]
MSKTKADEARLAPLLEIINKHPGGISLPDLKSALDPALNIGDYAVKYRLKALVESGRVKTQGERRWTKYFPVDGHSIDIVYSKQSRDLARYMSKPTSARQPASYDCALIETYEPNVSRYLTLEEQSILEVVGTDVGAEQPAGTYARRIMDRLLIDLSWNSSRLEGNTYSLLDTRRLIAFDEEAEGAAAVDAQMIRNHKEAIEFLVENAGEVDFTRHTVLNLHALLANNLLQDPMSVGRLRMIPVGIAGSTYLPLDDPHRIDAYFQLTLRKIAEIENPFEQALMALLFLPYLQPFDDVNKRVSRMAANIPFIKKNLIPLSFIEVSEDAYSNALVGFYECGDASMMKDLFIWAYRRSAQHYASVRQQLGAPDPFRMKYREALQVVVRELVVQSIPRQIIGKFIKAWAFSHIPVDDQNRFRDVAEVEVISMHEGNYARYRLRHSEFMSWKVVRDPPSFYQIGL